jgi:hypothetical protein
LFDSVQGTGSQLLLFSLKKILEGDLVLMAPEGGFACTYKGARGSARTKSDPQGRWIREEHFSATL